MDRAEILAWLREPDERRLDELWARADAVRRRHVGDAVHLRGLVEFSNHCVRGCAYCGLRAGNRRLTRYRMTADEIMACVRRAVAEGIGTVVLQSGEDDGTRTEWLAGLIRRIKTETPLAVTLSCGERPEADLAAWHAAGADRYLLRFETSNWALFRRIHPPCSPSRSRERDRERTESPHPRLALLARLRELGYETGGGAMVGIPGQGYEDLADDIETFRRLDLDMIGVGPYIPHPHTPLGRRGGSRISDLTSQISNFTSRTSNFTSQITKSNSERMALKVVALARIVCPRANIPSTTALAVVDPARGWELGLTRGANVIMPNLTPPAYRALYEIYPGKPGLFENTAEAVEAIRRRIAALGRHVGTGPGSARAARSPTVPAGARS